jgi:photosystem II stability/assembly factor-like uncharacterized protein
VFDTGVAGRVYASTYSHPYWSSDGGLTWTESNGTTGHNLRQVTVGPAGTTVAYLNAKFFFTDPSACSQLLKSTDSGESWVSWLIGLPPLAGIQQAAIDPANPNEAYVPTYEGIWKLTGDQSLTWLSGEFAAALVIDPRTPSTFYAAAQLGIDKSTDAGQTWQATSLRGVSDERSIVLDPQNPNVVYAVAAQGTYPALQAHVYRSLNGGQDWDLMDEGLPANEVFGNLVINSSGTTLYLGTDEGVFDFEIVQPTPVPIPPPVVISGRP